MKTSRGLWSKIRRCLGMESSSTGVSDETRVEQVLVITNGRFVAQDVRLVDVTPDGELVIHARLPPESTPTTEGRASL